MFWQLHDYEDCSSEWVIHYEKKWRAGCNNYIFNYNFGMIREEAMKYNSKIWKVYSTHNDKSNMEAK